jgi:hypothetical protein
VPVLLYHGIGPTSDFSNAVDAQYGVDTYDFAKQMTLIKHAGYQTIGLQTFVDFVRGKRVTLPPRPLLLTFDDARADSWTGSESILHKLHFTAVMFVDVGRVSACDPEYLTWDELRAMERTSRWNNQLHAGPNGHTFIQFEHEPDRPVLRVQEAGRGLLAVAGPRQVRHRSGAEGARRPDSGVQAARLRPSLRCLRTGRDERRADPIRSPRLALGTLRGGVQEGHLTREIG